MATVLVVFGEMREIPAGAMAEAGFLRRGWQMEISVGAVISLVMVI